MSAAAVEIRNLEPTLQLVKRAQKGDTEAFGTLFHTHRSRVYSLCLRMTRNIAEAEDLTQEAFLQVFRKLPTFRGDSALSTWMYRVAVNTVLMYFRKRGRPQFSIDEEPAANDQNGKSKKRDYGATDFQLSGCVDRIALARAIKELPHGYRKIFLLHEVEGYEHREIARLLRCSVGNSKSQLHKARLRMRELLTLGVLRQARQAEAKSNGHREAAAKQAEARVLEWPRKSRANRETHTHVPLRAVQEFQVESAA